MNYGAEDYINPPAPVAPAIETNTLRGEMLDSSKRPDLPTKKRMNFKEVILSARLGKSDVEVASAAHLLDMLIYTIFLVIIVFIAFCRNSSETYYYNSILKTTFTRCPQKDGTDLVDVNIINDFMNATVMQGLYWEETTDPLAAEGMVLFENILLGNPTFRMLKVRNDTCQVAAAFKREIKECYGSYSEDGEDRDIIGSTGAQFIWSSADTLQTSITYGKLAAYGGGGFNVEFPMSGVGLARSTLQQLQSVRFIDRGTRALIFDFAMYNGNVNVFCTIRILFELPPMGGVIAKAIVTPLDLIRYGDEKGDWIIVCEGLFAGLVAFFIVEELLEIFRCRLKYFQSFWNLIDVLLLSLSVICMILSYLVSLLYFLPELLQDFSTMAQMDDVNSAVNQYTNWSSVLLFIAFIKIFKYISINKTMSQLSETLTRSAKDIGGFAVMFCVFFFAYAQFGYLIFGSQIEDYSSFVSSMLALLRTILGDFDYVALQNANRILGPLFFVSFVFFVFFVLLNMFLAIINDSYVEVKGELNRKKGEMTLMDWVRQRINRLMHCRYGSRPPALDDPMITYEEYRNELVKVGYKEEDIMEAFTKVDIKDNDVISDLGMVKVTQEMSEILTRKKELKEEYQNYSRVRRRVDALETALEESSRRLDTILVTLTCNESDRADIREMELHYRDDLLRHNREDKDAMKKNL